MRTTELFFYPLRRYQDLSRTKNSGTTHAGIDEIIGRIEAPRLSFIKSRSTFNRADQFLYAFYSLPYGSFAVTYVCPQTKIYLVHLIV